MIRTSELSNIVKTQRTVISKQLDQLFYYIYFLSEGLSLLQKYYYGSTLMSDLMAVSSQSLKKELENCFDSKINSVNKNLKYV